MTRPYDRFIRFAVTAGCETAGEVNDLLKDLLLPEINDREFDVVYEWVHRTVPSPISDQIAKKQYHGDFIKWMKTLEIGELWLYELRREDHRFIKLAYDIHHDLQIRITVNSLLIKGSKHKDICSEVNSKFSSMLKPEHIQIYQKYFWDIQRMTRRAWKAYLKKAHNHEKAFLFRALTEPTEVVKTDLGLAVNADLSGNLQYFFTKACERARDCLKIRTPESDAEARKWIKTVSELADKYAKHRVGDIEDFSKSLQLEFDYVQNEFDTPDEAILQEVRAKDKANEQEGE